MLNVVVLNAIMLNVAVMNIVAPLYQQRTACTVTDASLFN
jgi:hypothetical protein